MSVKNSRNYILAFIGFFLIVGYQYYWIRFTYQEEVRKVKIDFNKCIQNFALEQFEKSLESMSDNHSTDSLGSIEDITALANAMKNLSDFSKSTGEELEVYLDVDSMEYWINKFKGDQNENAFIELHTQVAKALEDYQIYPDFGIWLFENKTEQLVDSFNVKTTRANLKIVSNKSSLHHPNYHFQFSINDPFLFILGRIKYTVIFTAILIISSILVFIVLLKAIYKQRELNKLKTNFVNNLTHELKTPIASCSAALEAIVNFNVIDNKEMTLKYINLANEQLGKMNELTDTILRSSAAEEKRMFFEFKKVSLVQLINQAIQQIQFKLEKNQINLITQLPESEVHIYADELHISNVLATVLDNAIKYNHTNGIITLFVAIDNNLVNLKVTNSGKGFKNDLAKHVFDKFYRISNQDIHEVKGFGLGLSYAKNVIEDHNGSITISSEPNKETVLTIKLPLYE